MIVTPDWVTQSVASQKRLPYGDYVAIGSLPDESTTEHYLEHDDQSRSASSSLPSPPKHLSYMSRFAVQRASPLVCPNQAMLVQLDTIRNARALDGDERSAMSYSRSIAVCSFLSSSFIKFMPRKGYKRYNLHGKPNGTFSLLK